MSVQPSGSAAARLVASTSGEEAIEPAACSGGVAGAGGPQRGVGHPDLRQRVGVERAEVADGLQRLLRRSPGRRRRRRPPSGGGSARSCSRPASPSSGATVTRTVCRSAQWPRRPGSSPVSHQTRPTPRRRPAGRRGRRAAPGGRRVPGRGSGGRRGGPSGISVCSKPRAVPARAAGGARASVAGTLPSSGQLRVGDAAVECASRSPPVRLLGQPARSAAPRAGRRTRRPSGAAPPPRSPSAASPALLGARGVGTAHLRVVDGQVDELDRRSPSRSARRSSGPARSIDSSSGLPMFIGPVSVENARARMPRTVSST